MFKSRVFSVEAVVNLILETYKGRGDSKLSLAIPGGRSPGPILSELSKRMSPEDKKRLSLLWVDERLVPQGDTDRNDASTLKSWEEGGALPGNVLPMPTGPDLNHEESIANYESSLMEACENGIIDVCLIGIGEDGHFASLFPNHPLLKVTKRVAIIEDSPKQPPLRMTLSLPQIKTSRLNIVLCFGSEKGNVFRKSQLGAEKSLPVSLLNPENTIWFLDDDAVKASQEG